MLFLTCFKMTFAPRWHHETRSLIVAFVSLTAWIFLSERFLPSLQNRGVKNSRSRTMAKRIDGDYWKQLWVDDHIGWHRTGAALSIIKHLDEMTAGQEKSRIFVPLCGKSKDLKWLADRGHSVVGAELSLIAVKDFFKENDVEYTTKPVVGLPDVDLYTSKDLKIKIYLGDMFHLNREIIGEFDCIWDRGSLVALPRDLLQKYVDLLTSLLKPNGRCLLETVEYDQSKMNGPPFSTPMETLQDIYAASWDIKKFEVFDAFREEWRNHGLDAFECGVYLLNKK